MECCVYSMDIDNLPKEKIMQLYQDIGMILGLQMVENTFVASSKGAKIEDKIFSELEIKDFCMKRAKAIEMGVEQFMKDNGIHEDTVVETE